MERSTNLSPLFIGAALVAAAAFVFWTKQPGELTFEDHTYAFVNQRANWSGAQEACAAYGMEPAFVESLEEMWFLHDAIYYEDHQNDSNWSWIAGTELPQFDHGVPLVVNHTERGRPQDALLPQHVTSKHKIVCEKAGVEQTAQAAGLGE